MPTQTYVLPDLPYDPGALEPHISGRIMELHHGSVHITSEPSKGTTVTLHFPSQSLQAQPELIS